MYRCVQSHVLRNSNSCQLEDNALIASRHFNLTVFASVEMTDDAYSYTTEPSTVTITCTCTNKTIY